MKITAQEEYGLRILLRIARAPETAGVPIPEISQSEGLSAANVAKLCRILRLGGYIKSNRGKDGGYTLSRAPEKIVLGEVLKDLGGQLYNDEFCENHAGLKKLCTNSIDCSIRSLWQVLQFNIDQILNNITVRDMLSPASPLTAAISPQDLISVTARN